jgi:hypothetical protein
MDGLQFGANNAITSIAARQSVLKDGSGNVIDELPSSGRYFPQVRAVQYTGLLHVGCQCSCRRGAAKARTGTRQLSIDN